MVISQENLKASFLNTNAIHLQYFQWKKQFHLVNLLFNTKWMCLKDNASFSQTYFVWMLL